MGRSHAAALCRELGAELRKIRTAAGLSEAELADKAGWWHAKISRMESGNINASDIDVVQYLAYCGCFLGEVQDIIDLCRLAEKANGYWLNSHGQHLGDSVRSLIFHEAAASCSTSYEPHVVPGLLQTEAYTRLMILRDRWRAPDNVEFCVRARMTRQQIMHRARPARFTFLMHEHALRHEVGSPAVMHEQVLALMLLDALPHVAIRVVPESSMFGEAFRLMHFAKHDSLAYLDLYVGGLFLEERGHVSAYNDDLAPDIARAALNEQHSREFLSKLASEYEHRSAREHVEEEQLQQR